MIRKTLSTLAAFVALGSGCELHKAAYAHDNTVKACFGGPHAKPMHTNIEENGMIAEAYDRNLDGKVDIVVVTPVEGLFVNPDKSIEYIHHAGLLYVVDQDYDGNPDMVFIDQTGEGKCSELKLYQNLLHGGSKEPQSGNVKS